MKIPYRQGIIRHQQDTQGNQSFLLEQSDGIDLIVTNDNTMVTFAHKDHNYVLSETKNVSLAWVGPFVSGSDYWLFWDLDLKTGIRTFGHTTLEPSMGPVAPANPIPDQHWFDTTSNTMKVFNGASFKDRVRVFAAKYEDGTVIEPVTGGSLFTISQIGSTTAATGGALIFDDADKPLKRGDNTFITTSDEFSTGIPTASNFKVEALTFEARASTNVAAYHIVYLDDFDSVLPASPFTINNVPYGIIQEDAYTGELINITTDGIIVNPNWDWQEAGAELYIDTSGSITTTQHPNMLPIGYVISPSEILLKSGGVTHVTFEGGVSEPGITSLTMGELTDVQYGSGEVRVNDGDILRYYAPDNVWVNTPNVFGGLTGVNVSHFTDSDGDVLTYDANTVSWVARPPSAGGGATVLSDLGDVSTSRTIRQGEILTFIAETNEWTNGPLDLYGMEDITFSPEISGGEVLMFDSNSQTWTNQLLTLPPVEGGATKLRELDDVIQSDFIQDGHILKFQGETRDWVSSTIDIRTLDDVAISFDLAPGDVLTYDGELGAWTNRATISDGGGIGGGDGSTGGSLFDLSDVGPSSSLLQSGQSIIFVAGDEDGPSRWESTFATELRQGDNSLKVEDGEPVYMNSPAGVTAICVNDIYFSSDNEIMLDGGSISLTSIGYVDIVADDGPLSLYANEEMTLDSVGLWTNTVRTADGDIVSDIKITPSEFDVKYSGVYSLSSLEDNGGSLTIDAASNSTGDGAPVTITAGSSTSRDGGTLTIRSGRGERDDGDVYIRSYEGDIYLRGTRIYSTIFADIEVEDFVKIGTQPGAATFKPGSPELGTTDIEYTLPTFVGGTGQVLTVVNATSDTIGGSINRATLGWTDVAGEGEGEPEIDTELSLRMTRTGEDDTQLSFIYAFADSWTTINCTDDTTVIFEYGPIDQEDPTKATEFTVEIYPGEHSVTWPDGLIGDTTITPNVMNIFTIVRRPAGAGLVERTYILKVAIPNDVTDPLQPDVLAPPAS